jgi:hypothetical protein
MMEVCYHLVLKVWFGKALDDVYGWVRIAVDNINDPQQNINTLSAFKCFRIVRYMSRWKVANIIRGLRVKERRQLE